MRSNREERQLMRQRGAGIRQLVGGVADFIFGAALQTQPSPNQPPNRKEPSRGTPRAEHVDPIEKKPNRTRKRAAVQSTSGEITTSNTLKTAPQARFPTSPATGKRKRGRPPLKKGGESAFINEGPEEHGVSGVPAVPRKRTKKARQEGSVIGASVGQAITAVRLTEEVALDLERKKSCVLAEKKRRGRPRETTASKPQSEVEACEAEAKQRGRPRETAATKPQSEVEACKRTQSISPSPVKLPITSAQRNLSSQEQDEDDTLALAAEILCSPTSEPIAKSTKRKRGRPRKETVPAVVRHEHAVPKNLKSLDTQDARPVRTKAEDPLKSSEQPLPNVKASSKRRGRPRKMPIQVPKEADDTGTATPTTNEAKNNRGDIEPALQLHEPVTRKMCEQAATTNPPLESVKEASAKAPSRPRKPSTSAAPSLLRARKPLHDRTNTTALPSTSSSTEDKVIKLLLPLTEATKVSKLPTQPAPKTMVTARTVSSRAEKRQRADANTTRPRNPRRVAVLPLVADEDDFDELAGG